MAPPAASDDDADGAVATWVTPAKPGRGDVELCDSKHAGKGGKRTKGRVIDDEDDDDDADAGAGAAVDDDAVADDGGCGDGDGTADATTAGAAAADAAPTAAPADDKKTRGSRKRNRKSEEELAYEKSVREARMKKMEDVAPGTCRKQLGYVCDECVPFECGCVLV